MRKTRQFIRPRRRGGNQGVSSIPAPGDNVSMGSKQAHERDRRRVIAESLTAPEQAYFRREMDVAQKVSLGKRKSANVSVSTTERKSGVVRRPTTSAEEDYYGCFSRGLSSTTQPGTVQLDEWTRSVESAMFHEWKRRKKEREPMRIEEVMLRDRSAEDQLDGDSIVDLWFQCMGKIEERLTLSEQQKDFIRSCFISLLPLIYGDQFDVNIVRLTKRFGIDAIFKKIFFEMPRRFGKTTSTAIVASIIAYIIPGLTVGIYSIVKSASDSLVESVIDYYATISGMDQIKFITEWNKQKGRVCLVNATGTTSTVWGYAAVGSVRTFPPLFVWWWWWCRPQVDAVEDRRGQRPTRPKVEECQNEKSIKYLIYAHIPSFLDPHSFPAVMYVEESFRLFDKFKESQEPKGGQTFKQRYYRHGLSRDQLHHLFDAVNAWLPTRYEWIVASLSTAPSDAKTPQDGRLFHEIRERERVLSTPARYDVDVRDQVGVENESDAMRIRDAVMLEARCMVYLTAECSADCKIDFLQNDSDIPLYGCRDHGLIHVCIGDRTTCTAGYLNKDKEMICVYSGLHFCGTIRSIRMYDTRRNHSYLQELKDEEADEEADEGGGEEKDGTTLEELLDTSCSEVRKKRKNHFSKISNAKLNWAMVRSAVVSGRGCVVTAVAEEILCKEFFPWVGRETLFTAEASSDSESRSITELNEIDQDQVLIDQNILFRKEENERFVSRSTLHDRDLGSSALFSEAHDVVASKVSSNRSRLCNDPETEETTWNIQRAQETRYSVDPYKETLSRKMTWDSLARGMTPTFLVEGTDGEKMDVASRMDSASTLSNSSPYSTPMGVMTMGEGLVMSPGRQSTPSSPSSGSGSPPPSPMGRRVRRKRGAPKTTLRRGYSLTSGGQRVLRKKKKKNARKNQPKKVNEQYYLVREEDANSTRSKKKRKRINRRKSGLSLSASVRNSQFIKSNNTTMVVGKMADIFMGKPSLESMKSVVLSNSMASEAEAEAEADTEADTKADTKAKAEPEVSASSTCLIGTSRRKRRMTMSASVPTIDYTSFEFKRRRQKFSNWVETQSLAKEEEMAACVKAIGEIMNDLIFNAQKRESMKIAYGIASLINTEEAVKRSLTRVEKELRTVREREKKAHRDLRRKYKKKEYRVVRIRPASFIWDYCARNTAWYGKEPLSLLSTQYDPTTGDKGLEFITDDEDHMLYKYGANPPEGGKIGVPMMTLGDMDDLYAEKLRVDAIEVIPHNPEKKRRYTNEIARLWRVLLAGPTVKEEHTPKSQFDHFVLGVLYYLATEDIVIGGKVVMRRDEWLSEVLPSQKRLCDNHTGKLLRKDVAEVIQKNTDLNEHSLKFSTPSRVYASKVVTKGCRRVKMWTSDFQCEDVDALIEYVHRNSVVEFIKVNNTMGNTSRGRGMYHRRRTGLFQ